jgi:hypothetical protein
MHSIGMAGERLTTAPKGTTGPHDYLALMSPSKVSVTVCNGRRAMQWETCAMQWETCKNHHIEKQSGVATSPHEDSITMSAFLMQIKCSVWHEFGRIMNSIGLLLSQNSAIGFLKFSIGKGSYTHIAILSKLCITKTYNQLINWSKMSGGLLTT